MWLIYPDCGLFTLIVLSDSLISVTSAIANGSGDFLPILAAVFGFDIAVSLQVLIKLCKAK